MITIDNPLYYNLIIKKSNIHGLGVFTTKDIKKNHRIVPYTYVDGNLINYKDFIKKYGNDFRYTYTLQSRNQIINVKNNRNIISYVNDNRPNHNCYLKCRSGRCRKYQTCTCGWCKCKRGMYALRDIKKNEELTLQYQHYHPKNM